MITFKEYYSFLEKQATLSNFYYEEFENLAKSAKYMRNYKVVKKYQKELERKKTASFNVLNNIFKEEQKKKGVIAVVKVNQKKDNKLKLFFKKLFGIKSPVLSGIIEEFSETAGTPPEDQDKPEVDSDAILIDDEIEDGLEEDFDYEDWDDEDEEDYHCDDRIEGQMDIEDLNEGDVYEEKESKKS